MITLHYQQRAYILCDGGLMHHMSYIQTWRVTRVTLCHSEPAFYMELQESIGWTQRVQLNQKSPWLMMSYHKCYGRLTSSKPKGTRPTTIYYIKATKVQSCWRPMDEGQVESVPATLMWGISSSQTSEVQGSLNRTLSYRDHDCLLFLPSPFEDYCSDRCETWSWETRRWRYQAERWNLDNMCNGPNSWIVDTGTVCRGACKESTVVWITNCFT